MSMNQRLRMAIIRDTSLNSQARLDPGEVRLLRSNTVVGGGTFTGDLNDGFLPYKISKEIRTRAATQRRCSAQAYPMISTEAVEKPKTGGRGEVNNVR
jgi:hypothetical protein